MKVKYVPMGIGEEYESLLVSNGCIFADTIRACAKVLTGSKVAGYVRTATGVKVTRNPKLITEFTADEIKEAENMLNVAEQLNINYKLIEQDYGAVSQSRIAIFQPTPDSAMVVDLDVMEMYNIKDQNVISKLVAHTENLDYPKSELDALIAEVVACK